MPTVKPRTAIRRKLSPLDISSESKTNDETQNEVLKETQEINKNQSEQTSIQTIEATSNSKHSFLNRAFALIPFSNERNKTGVLPSSVDENTTNQAQTAPKNENPPISKTHKLISYLNPIKSSTSSRTSTVIIDLPVNSNSQINSDETVQQNSVVTETVTPIQESDKEEIIDNQSSPNLVIVDTNISTRSSESLEGPLDQPSDNQITLLDKSIIKTVIKTI